MAVKNSPNLLSPDDERDPRTLGDDTTSTPGGTTNVDELLFGRSEERIKDFEAIADTQKQTLQSLSRQFEIIDKMEFGQFNEIVDASALDAGPPQPGLKMRRLRRALNREYEQRGKFEVAKTKHLAQIANGMAMSASQLRQADPAADAFITGIAEAAADKAMLLAKIKNADVMANLAVGVLARDIGPERAEALRGALRTQFASVPSAEELLKGRLTRDQALAHLGPSLPESQILTYPGREQEILRNAKEVAVAAENKKGRGANRKTPAQLISDYMQPANLTKVYDDEIREPTLRALQYETVVPGRGGVSHISEKILPGLGKIPVTDDLNAYADILSAESFYDKLLSRVGSPERAERAFELKFGQTEGARLIERVKERLDMSPEARVAEREQIFDKILTDLRDTFGGGPTSPGTANGR